VPIIFTYSLNASQQDSNSGDSAADTNRYKVFSFRHISSDQAIGYIEKAGLAVTARALKENILSTSGQSAELGKVAELLRLVDSNVPFIVEKIVLPKQAADSNSPPKLGAKTNGVLIGTFANPPMGEGAKAIVEVSETGILVVAPADKADQIRFSFGGTVQASAKQPAAEQAGQTAQPADVNVSAAEPNVSAELMNTILVPQAEQIPAIDANLLEGITVNIPENIPADKDTSTLIDINKLDINWAAVEALLRGDSKTSTETESNEVPLSDVFGKLVGSLSKASEKTTTAQKEANDVNTAAPVKIQTQPPAEKPAKKTTVTERAKQPGQSAGKTANESLEPTPIADGNEILELTLPERMNIVQLIRLVGEYFSLDYMYDPAKVTGEITLQISKERQGRIKVKELYPLLEQALKFRGFVMTRRGNLVTIVPKEEAITIDPALVDTAKRSIEKGDVVITKVFHLKYIDAESAKNLLMGMGMGVDINTSASVARILIVTEYAYRMGRVQQLLDMIDKPGEKKTFHFRQLKYTMATSLKDKIKALADQLGTITITIAETVTVSPATQPAVRPGMPPAITRPPVTTVRTPTAAGAAEVPTVYLDVDERTNRILMIGLPEQLDTVESLIDTLDVQQQDLRSMRVYELKYADATDVVNKLGELNIISSTRAATIGRGRTTTTRYPGTTTGAERITQPGAPGTIPQTTVPVTGTAGASTEPLAGEPQIVVIETTNSLLVNATEEQHEQIATIMAYLDTEPEASSTNYVVYPLENQDPEQLVEVLNKLIQETIESKDPTGKVIQTSTTKRTEEDITIIGDKNTFSVIVYASKRNQQWIESLIRQLDKRRPQVLIDITLVEVTKNDEFSLDMQLVTKYPTIEKVLDTGVETPIPLLSTYPGRRMWEASSISGSGTGFYSDEHVQALIKAMRTKGYGRVMANPKLLVNDNETGTITTLEEQTVVSPSTVIIPGSPTTSPTASATVSKDVYKAEIKLDIVPHISEGDLLRLEVTLKRSDIRPVTPATYTLETPDGKLTGPSPPDTVSADVKTVITVPDSKTIILGGLEKLNQSKGGTKVPLLGDLPLVGVFFRKTESKDAQSRLYLFVRANILRPEKEQVASDIVRMSDKNREEFEKFESEMQNYQNFPGIKQKFMDPQRVLGENGTSDK